MQTFDHPYKHIVIDDYLPQDVYNNIVNDVMSRAAAFQLEDYAHSDTHNNTTDWLDVSGEWQFLAAESNYLDASFLIEHFAEKQHRPFNNLEASFDINWSKAGHEHEIHSESARKILTAVTYLYPQAANGTVLYNKDKEFVKEIEWKPNRCFIMCGLQDITWHSFYAPKDQDRITLVTKLVEAT